MGKFKVVPDAATRFMQIANLWVEVRCEEAEIHREKAEIAEGHELVKMHTKNREELLAKIGAIIEDTQLSLGLEEGGDKEE